MREQFLRLLDERTLQTMREISSKGQFLAQVVRVEQYSDSGIEMLEIQYLLLEHEMYKAVIAVMKNGGVLRSEVRPGDTVIIESDEYGTVYSVMKTNPARQ